MFKAIILFIIEKIWKQTLGAVAFLAITIFLFYQYNFHPDDIDLYHQQTANSVPPLPDTATGATSGPRLQVTWLGVSGFLLRYGQNAILIDPFASRRGMLGVGLGAKLNNNTQLIKEWYNDYNIQDVRAVFVSHSHYDHSMDAPLFARMSGAKLYGSQSTLNIGRGHKLPETSLQEIHHGQIYVFGDLTIWVLESKHGPALLGRIPYPGTIDKPLEIPARAKDYKLGKTYSFLISYPGGGELLHHASADRLPHTLQGIRADRILLGIAGRADTKDYLERVVFPVRPAQVIPVHFDNFFAPVDFSKPQILWNVWLSEFLETLQTYDRAPRIVFLPLGQAVKFPD